MLCAHHGTASSAGPTTWFVSRKSLSLKLEASSPREGCLGRLPPAGSSVFPIPTDLLRRLDPHGGEVTVDIANAPVATEPTRRSAAGCGSARADSRTPTRAAIGCRIAKEHDNVPAAVHDWGTLRRPRPRRRLTVSSRAYQGPRRLRPTTDAWSWQLRARCRDAAPNLFFHPEGGRGLRRLRHQQRAKSVCSNCPVTAECGEHALSFGEFFGTWGWPVRRRASSHARQASTQHFAAATD
jgi:WhiB family transcriptional regulator, redox-sensing transcriptional regulator